MKSKFIILFIIIILALSSTSVAALMFWQGQNLPILNKVVTAPFIESGPNEVLGNMFGQLKVLSTARYDLQSEIDWKVYDEVFKISINNVFEGNLLGRPIGKMVTNIGMDIESLNFLSTIESRFTEEKIYYSVTEVPAIPFVDLEKIHTKWYEYSWQNDNKFNDQLFLGMNSVSTNNIIKKIERLPDEYINNKLSYHYLLSVDLKNVKFGDLFGYSDVFNMDSSQIQQIELWVGKQSFLPYKITNKYLTDEMIINSTLIITGFNESVAIDRPENGIRTDKFIKDLFGGTNLLDLSVFGYLVGLDEKYLIDDPDDDELYSVWEDVFGTDKNNSDTDDDGFIDGAEIRNGYSPLGTGQLIRSYLTRYSFFLRAG